MIPASVIVVTKNEEKNIEPCLQQLAGFDDVWVVDSESRDKTLEKAKKHPVHIQTYHWDGKYPKKRQWCLDNLPIKYDWVFFLDADEIVSPDFLNEIHSRLSCAPSEAGFFIRADYRLNNRILRFGLKNKKIALLHKSRMEFPVVDDLDIPGMGEIEGHYQPVLKSDSLGCRIGSLRTPIIHDALADERAWLFRHEKYARWESGMNKKNAWPKDPVPWRENLKVKLRSSSFRAEIMFLVGFVFFLGFLDGKGGFFWAKQRYRYLTKINKL